MRAHWSVPVLLTLTACAGGGSNAIGLFHAFLQDEQVKIVGVEAAGSGGIYDSMPMSSMPPIAEWSIAACIEASSGPCREFRLDASVGSSPDEEVYGTACLQPDGSWLIQ